MKRLLLSKIEPFMMNKGAIGAARAKQVEAFCLTVFYQYLSSSLSERHFKLLLFLHSLLILCEQENHHFDERNNHANSVLSSRLWKLLGVSLKRNELQYLCEFQLEDDVGQPPDYLELNSWANLRCLETSEPNTFPNLTKSLRENPVKWREYFWPHSSPNVELIEKDVDLLNEPPLGVKMGFVEKLALWFCVRPDKV